MSQILEVVKQRRKYSCLKIDVDGGYMQTFRSFMLKSLLITFFKVLYLYLSSFYYSYFVYYGLGNLHIYQLGCWHKLKLFSEGNIDLIFRYSL